MRVSVCVLETKLLIEKYRATDGPSVLNPLFFPMCKYVCNILLFAVFKFTLLWFTQSTANDVVVLNARLSSVSGCNDDSWLP